MTLKNVVYYSCLILNTKKYYFEFVNKFNFTWIFARFLFRYKIFYIESKYQLFIYY